MATFCESYDSNWMDGGSCSGFDENLDHADADAFEAALEPLPTWDGVAYSASGGITNGRSSEKYAAAVPPRRHHDWARSSPHTSRVDHGKILNSLDLQTLSLEDDEGGVDTSAGSTVLRKSMLAANTDFEAERPLPSWSDRPTAQKPRGSPPEPERILTHVVRLHRTGSVVVERTASPRASSAGPVTAEAPGRDEPAEGEYGDYYAEEQRFWRERCPAAEAAATDRRDKQTSTAVAVQRHTPQASSSLGAQAAAGRAANYDYLSAEAAYRSSPRSRAAADPLHSSSQNHGSGSRRAAGGSTPCRHRRTNSDREGGDFLNDADNPQPPNSQPPQPPRRHVVRDRSGAQDAARVRTRNAEERRLRARSRSLRDAEAVLHGVLESVEGGLATIEDSSPSRMASNEDRPSALRQRVAESYRREIALPTTSEEDTPNRRPGSRRGPSPIANVNQVHRRRKSAGSTDDVIAHSPSLSSGPCSPQEEPSSHVRDLESVREIREAMRDSSPQQEYHDDREGEEDGEESAVRVAELSRRIASRCLSLEQECSRRERSQTRLFQEQLRGVRQAAQQVARRTIRDERSRVSQVLAETQKRFEEREAAALKKFEQMEASWKAERETLAANLSNAKSELERTRRLAREAAEAGKNDAEAALEKQRVSLQRGWAEEKGGLRRAAEDALRRAVDAKTRVEEEAALKAQLTQDSLSAQVRSWKAKAEAAERRATEERDKRRRLEAGAKGALAQEVEKARESQESIVRELRVKAEADRAAHSEEIERIKEEHRANLLRVHQDKKRLTEAARRQWEQEMHEVRADAAARIEDAAARSAAERSEALRRLRLAHDVEMRKAGRDILRLEREARRSQLQERTVEVARSRNGASSLSPLPPGAYSPKPVAEAADATSCLDGVEAEGGMQALSSPGFGSCKVAASPGDSVALPSSRAGVARGGNGALEMAKHRQNKGTKKHVKNRPRKSRPSDRNRAPTDYSIEINTNGNFPGAPPVFELESEPEEGIDTKASVIEALASAEWDAAQAAEPAVDESKEMEVVMGGAWKA
eukprot:g2507.t1